MEKKSEPNLTSIHDPSLSRKQSTLTVSEMLTPSEIAQLQQEKKEANAFFKKAFSRTAPKKK